MSDIIFKTFLDGQNTEAMALAQDSPVLDLVPASGDPTNIWVAKFNCVSLVRQSGGQIEEADEFHVGIHFDRDYLRRVPPTVVTLIGPLNCWHPNILGPGICLGHITPGTSLVDIIYQVYEILTFQNWVSHDALNPAAAEWARKNQERFPTDRRPLKGAASLEQTPLAELIEVTGD